MAVQEQHDADYGPNEDEDNTSQSTLEGEAVVRRRYQETGLSLENGGCVGDPHVVVERRLVFLCILHCCLAMGRLQVAFVEARLGDLPKDNAVAMQRVLYWARTIVRLGASALPHGDEAWAWPATGLRPGGW